MTNAQSQKMVTIPSSELSDPLGSPADFQIALDGDRARRKMLLAYISDELKDGVDYGRIHIVKDCKNKYDCSLDYHYSKPCLFKPGAEKIQNLLRLRPTFVVDKEMLDLLPESIKATGAIPFTCTLYRGETIVTVGKGAATVQEKGSLNVAIKIAKKRALMDAILSLGLSDSYTQDVDEMTADSQTLGFIEKALTNIKIKQTGETASRPSPPIGRVISPPALDRAELVTMATTLYNGLRAKGRDNDKLTEWVAGLDALTEKEIQNGITRMQAINNTK